MNPSQRIALKRRGVTTAGAAEVDRSIDTLFGDGLTLLRGGKEPLVIKWYTAGGGGHFGLPKTQECSFNGRHRNWTTEFARIDFYRGDVSLDWTNEDWANLFELLPALRGLNPGLQNKKSRGNVVESLVGASYAAADQGQDLWRRSGSYIRVTPQEKFGELAELFALFQRIGVRAPKALQVDGSLPEYAVPGAPELRQGFATAGKGRR